MHPRNGGRVGERGVSNVIGIILVVGITVILASVVAVNFVGMGNSVEKPPDNVLLSTDYDDQGDDVLTIEHRSGDELDAAKVRIDVDGAKATGGSPVEVELITDFASKVGSDDIFRSGETIVLDSSSFQRVDGTAIGSDQLDLSDADVRLIWKSSAEATTSDTLYHCDVEHPNCENRE